MAHSYEKTDNKTALVKVSRELSSGRRRSVNELRDLCAELGEKGLINQVLDFSRVKLCPSVVFGNIVVLAKRLKEKGGKVCIASPTPHVAKAAEITGITRVVGMYGTVDEATKAIGNKEN